MEGLDVILSIILELPSSDLLDELEERSSTWLRLSGLVRPPDDRRLRLALFLGILKTIVITGAVGPKRK
jgi:hypothetical protein